MQRLHAAALVLAGAAVPFGEGLGLGALVLLVVVTAARKGELDFSVFWEPRLRWVLGGLALWFLAGLVAIPLSGQGWLKPGELGRWVPLLAMPAAVLSATCLPRRTFERAGAAFVLALLVASLFALLQYAFDVRPGESLSRAPSTIATQGRVPGRFEHTVAGGFYYHRLKMAHVLVIGTAALFARQLFGSLSVRRRALELLALAIFLVTAALTYTRGALLAIGVAGIACLPFASRRWRLFAGAGIVVAAVVALSTPAVRQRLASAGSEETSSVRALIWSQAVRVLGDHPLGVGLGNYSAVVSRYYDVVDPAFNIRTYPHNLWLAAWVEAGPVGLAGYAVFLAGLVVACAGVLLGRGRGGRATAAAGLFGTVAVAVIGLTHDVLYHNAVALAFSGLAGLALASFVAAPLRDDHQEGAVADQPVSRDGPHQEVDRLT